MVDDSRQRILVVGTFFFFGTKIFFKNVNHIWSKLSCPQFSSFLEKKKKKKKKVLEKGIE